MAKKHIDTEWLAGQISIRTTRGIATRTTNLIANGQLELGEKLPPLRELAYVMKVSPATLSNAWKELRKLRVITGKGRNGSWISGVRTSPGPSRFLNAHPSRMGQAGNYDNNTIDLSWSVPDPDLLPSLEKAMQHGVKVANLNSYDREKILPELREAVEARWPYKPEGFLVTNGGYSAIHAILHALYFAGAKIAVEDPTPMRILDIIEDMGVEPVPVACDENGPIPDALEEALMQEPQAFFYQPRLHSILGAKMTSQRSKSLAKILENSKIMIIEDDGLGDISSLPPLSLGKYFPDRVVHILSFSKALGPDLRVAVLSAPLSIISKIQSFRAFSSGWTSRIMQSATAWLLKDEATFKELEKAREIYKQRRESLYQAFDQYGVNAFRSRGEGFSIWLPVLDEQFAMITLASRRIAVLPGSKCSVYRTQALRISTSNLVDNYDYVAQAVRLVLKLSD